jgi:phospholipase D1/2
LRSRWLAALRDHDRYDRLRVIYPLAAGDPTVAVNVHAKVMVADDEILRVGSANFTNRSMGLDTECDIVVAAGGDERIRSAIRRLRNRMLAHHLGIDPVVIGDDRALVALLDDATEEGTRVRRLALPRPEDQVEPLIADNVIDPFEPMDSALARSVLPSSLQREGRRRLPRVLWLVVVLLVLAGVWAWTPLRGWVQPERLAEAALGLESSLWGPVLFVLVMALATLAMVPVTALIVAASLLFGPITGAVCGLCGSLLSASVGYGAGRRILHAKIQRVAGRRLQQLSRALGRRGVLSVLAVRVVPVAPFTIVNLVAGSSHVRFRDFLIGTVIGMLPGLVGLSVAADRVAAAVRSPDTTTLVVAGVIVAVVAATLHLMRRWLQRVAARD